MKFNDEQRKSLYENFKCGSEVEVVEHEGELLAYDPESTQDGSVEL